MEGSTMVLTIAEVLPAAAEIFVAAAACVILLVEAGFGARARNASFLLAIAALAGAAWVTSAVAVPERTVILGGHFLADPMGTVLKLFAYGAAALTLLYSRDYLERRELLKGEYLVLALFAVLGIQVIVSAGSLLTLYLGIEIMSLSLYAMVAFDRDDGVAAESAMKYFVLGAIASGALLYGISILYGVTGSFLLDGIAASVGESDAPAVGLLFGLAFIVVGVAFKFGAVPFHMWLPDVYHGAPTPVTLFVGSAPKIASFALAMRVLAEGLGGVADAWQDMLVVLAALSMVVGNVVAIAQSNIKRMLAYSTISHVGFILLGVLAGKLRRLSRRDVLYADLRNHDDRRLWHRSVAFAQGLRGGRARRLQGPQPAQSLVRLRDAAGHLRAGGCPANRRFLGEASGHCRSPGRRPHVAGRAGRAHVGGRGLLLPAHRQTHVLR